MRIEPGGGPPPTDRPAVGASGEPRRVVIVGGGIAGLATAWYLEREAARRGLPLRYTVVERSERWGGKLQTDRVPLPAAARCGASPDVHSGEAMGRGLPAAYGGTGNAIADDADAPFLLEAGPDAFLTRKPWALALARELGLSDRIQGVNRANARTYVLHSGRLVPMPPGVHLLAPTRLWPFVRSPLFSARGKLRVALDLLLPARRDPADESLAAFTRRRFGAEALDRLAEPLMAGVYNAVPAEQSMLATFPQYPALERRHGSVIRGLRSAARAPAPPARDGADVAQTGEDMPPFISFPDGTHTLVAALLARLGGELRARRAAERIERAPAGGYRVVLDDGSALDADAVVVATPARAAAALLRAAAPAAAAALATFRTAGIGALYLGYRRIDVPRQLDGFGVVIPSGEGRRLDGITFASSKWAGRAPPGYVLLRAFFGGPHTRAMLALPDAELLAAVRDEVAAILGIRATPLLQRAYRWPEGYPQYDVGHLERVAAAEAALPAGLCITGSAYRGVGVPDCIHQGREAARRVVASLVAADRRHPTSPRG